MDRKDILLDGVSKDQLGIEIAPWFNPLVPKAAGFRSLSLDVLNTEDLRRRAENDPSVEEGVSSRIEEVDLVGSACDIDKLAEGGGLLGQCDYVISSHNFEHLPNPIRFLNGCERVLKVDGVLVMAVPDRRTSFDYFKPHSTSADFIAAFAENRKEPTAHQLFMQNSLRSSQVADGKQNGGFWISDDPALIRPLEALEDAYEACWKKAPTGYIDTHCWAFTPSSLRLILEDLHYLGLISLEVDFVSPQAFFNEFYVRLKKPEKSVRAAQSDFYARRAELLHKINDEASENSRAMRAVRNELEETKRSLAAREGTGLWRRFTSRLAAKS